MNPNTFSPNSCKVVMIALTPPDIASRYANDFFSPQNIAGIISASIYIKMYSKPSVRPAPNHADG